MVGIIRRLRAQKGVLTKKKFEDLQKSLGFNFVADGILDGEVLGITSLQFDWAHCVLIQGTFHTEAHVRNRGFQVFSVGGVSARMSHAGFCLRTC